MMVGGGEDAGSGVRLKLLGRQHEPFFRRFLWVRRSDHRWRGGVLLFVQASALHAEL